MTNVEIFQDNNTRMITSASFTQYNGRSCLTLLEFKGKHYEAA
jgi:hypothetical protein